VPSQLDGLCERWGVGVMPLDGGGDKRGWSLRGKTVYRFLSEDGKTLCYVGRDPEYEDKLAAYDALRPEKRDPKKAPAKHHFPKTFARPGALRPARRAPAEGHTPSARRVLSTFETPFYCWSKRCCPNNQEVQRWMADSISAIGWSHAFSRAVNWLLKDFWGRLLAHGDRSHFGGLECGIGGACGVSGLSGCGRRFERAVRLGVDRIG
jgi:hypothetical protein